MEGIVLFFKPQNFYSTQIVNYFKKLSKNKVGHGGALDKMAEGLIILGIGKFTKYLNYFLNKSVKTYLADIMFGYYSKTYDTEIKDEVKKVSDCQIDLKELEKVLMKLKNIRKIKQKPPIFSALKIKGVPAYKLARKNVDFNLKEREVYFYNFKIISFSNNILRIRIKTSSGFYVRSFAFDLGKEVNCPAIVSYILREKINNFSIKNALRFDDIEKDFLGLMIKFYGLVQGVGFRYFCYKKAKKYSINGYAKNLKDGSVRVIAQGKLNDLINFYYDIKDGSPFSKVKKIIPIWYKSRVVYTSFSIL